MRERERERRGFDGISKTKDQRPKTKAERKNYLHKCVYIVSGDQKSGQGGRTIYTCVYI